MWLLFCHVCSFRFHLFPCDFSGFPTIHNLVVLAIIFHVQLWSLYLEVQTQSLLVISTKCYLFLFYLTSTRVSTSSNCCCMSSCVSILSFPHVLCPTFSRICCRLMSCSKFSKLPWLPFFNVFYLCLFEMYLDLFKISPLHTEVVGNREEDEHHPLVRVSF